MYPDLYENQEDFKSLLRLGSQSNSGGMILLCLSAAPSSNISQAISHRQVQLASLYFIDQDGFGTDPKHITFPLIAKTYWR